ncbi:MAG: ABC transporter ATP-binding protein [Defluviitaleaceae bacterium]|nr:ABC transporter ATP-binding protein [Defluviitaleaceae bacterium]
MTILKVENLSIAFGGLKAVDDLSFSVNQDEIYGLIGPNGAGKTTVFNCITQFYKPNQGKILFNDTDLVLKATHNIIKLGLVRTFQNVELTRDLTLLENLLVGAHISYKYGLFANSFKLPKAKKEEKEIAARGEGILDFLGLLDKKNELTGGQPYGILKKVELGRTLMSNPKMIILDEPAAGLNDTETIELATLIRSIRTQYNCSILLVEHDMRLVMDVCDRICAISFGKKLAEGTPKEIQQSTAVQEAYLGISDDTEVD